MYICNLVNKEKFKKKSNLQVLFIEYNYNNELLLDELVCSYYVKIKSEQSLVIFVLIKN